MERKEMKHLIKKILKENDFKWAESIDPLKSFEDYFYGNYKTNVSGSVDTPGKWIKRDISWWENWIDDVRSSHTFFLEEVDELRGMVSELVNPTKDFNESLQLSKDVYSFTDKQPALNNKTIFFDLASNIRNAYETLGGFCLENDLNIIEALDIFEIWLNKRKSNNEPLHKN